jgi:hypothetical protein
VECLNINHTSHIGMSDFKNFAIAGAGEIGSFIVRQFLQDKATGKVNEVVVLTRQVGLPIVHDFGFD